MEKFQVNVGGIPELQNLVLDHGIKLGYKLSHRESFIDKTLKYFQFAYFNDNCITYCNHLFNVDKCKEISLVEFLQMKKQRIVKLKLNNDYEAVITQDGIKVGCQTFSFNKFDELVEAVKSFRTPQ